MRSKRFLGLRPRQLEVFEQIATGHDRGHHPSTVASLLKAGFITRLPDITVGRDVLCAITIPQYEVPLAVHFWWCQWCNEIAPDSTISTTTPEKSDDA